jgi:hypothetical protein
MIGSRIKKASVLILALITAFSCMSQQGITGKVVWVSGNQMPGPGNQNRPPEGIQREIHIYKPATPQQTKQANGFYTAVHTELVATVLTNANGSFTAKLPPGEYSVFTKEKEGLFANIFDGQGRIHVIEVKPGNFTEITFRVDYQAAY